MAERRPSLLLAARRPSRAAGVATAALAITVTTLALYPLRELTSAVSLGVVYLLSVLLVSTYWGALLVIATAVASAAAFNFFHIPPTGRFTIADGENWVALGVYVAAAIAVSSIAEAARARGRRGRAAPARGRPRRRAGAAAARRRRRSTARSAPRPSASPPRSSSRRRRSATEPSTATSGARRSRCTAPGRCSSRATRRRRCWTALEERIAPALETLMVAALDREALVREVVESPRCGARTSSRPRSCAPSRTTCARR